ncbi:MAG: hypothetical protein D6718_13245 [Acidobacteria bacterium]|nr:MAG: hypothetical protein D6718_13245 [Acidobacteriota bacterium]
MALSRAAPASPDRRRGIAARSARGSLPPGEAERVTPVLPSRAAAGRGAPLRLRESAGPRDCAHRPAGSPAAFLRSGAAARPAAAGRCPPPPRVRRMIPCKAGRRGRFDPGDRDRSGRGARRSPDGPRGGAPFVREGAMRSSALLAGAALVALGGAAPRAGTSGLTFEERVAAQRAIDAVYEAHRRRVPVALVRVPVETAQREVRDTLRKSVALERVYGVRVTGEMLARERARIERGTRAPGRLREIYGALGRDPRRIAEVLARSLLVDRLLRHFYAFDTRRHGEERARAEELRRRLAAGEPVASRPGPFTCEGVPGPSGAVDCPCEPAEGFSIEELTPAALAARERSFGDGGVAQVVETREAFEVPVLAARGERSLCVARYAVRKRPFELWWREVAASFDAPVGAAGAADSGTGIPQPAAPSGGSGRIPDDAWDTAGLEDVPAPRQEHTAVWTGAEMIVWGGRSGFEELGDGWRYDPATDTWSRIALAGAPEPRHLHSAVWTGTEMIVWGGEGTRGALATGAAYDPALDAWSALPAAGAPAPRWGHAAVWTGTEMIVWGGEDGSSMPAAGGRYDPQSRTWRGMSTGPSPRIGHTAIWTGAEMVVWGGEDDTASLGDGWRYDPASDRWTPLPVSGAPAPRSRHAAVWTGGEMIVWGGCDAFAFSCFDDGRIWDGSTNSWRPMSSAFAPGPRWRHTAVWTGGEMIVWGGSRFGTPATGGRRYDPALDHWFPVSTLNQPAARDGHTAVWTGSEMIVWGGGDLDSGGRYDPAADRWLPTSVGDEPERRFGHTAVWTGSEMIVWGGQGPAGVLDSGALYDPATDAWLPTPVLGAPQARRDHSAVWTGSEMIVWGGAAGGTALNSGGRFDPSTGLWTPTASGGAPEGRWDHTAVWTGSEMIVWGGAGPGSAVFGSGGRYDPQADGWEPVAAAGAPSPRTDHTAVWTGSEMIVWGGAGGGGNALGDGASYDPAADTWAPVTLAGAPAARHLHTAIWSGEEMVVWGGRGSAGERLDDGGRFAPATGSWRPVATDGAPSPRSEHTAVWLFARMLVWGGSDGTRRLASGGRYDPAGDRWLPMASEAGPSPRSAHTAVATDLTMIVWGGTGGAPLRTGGVYDPGRTSIDDDGDGSSEEDGDCDDTDASVFHVPLEIGGVRWSDRTTLAWESDAPNSGSGTAYDVVRGPVSDLPVGGSGEICLASEWPETTVSDAERPVAGAGFDYLVRGTNRCGDGPYGWASDGAIRSSGACP